MRRLRQGEESRFVPFSRFIQPFHSAVSSDVSSASIEVCLDHKTFSKVETRQHCCCVVLCCVVLCCVVLCCVVLCCVVLCCVVLCCVVLCCVVLCCVG